MTLDEARTVLEQHPAWNALVDGTGLQDTDRVDELAVWLRQAKSKQEEEDRQAYQATRSAFLELLQSRADITTASFWKETKEKLSGLPAYE